MMAAAAPRPGVPRWLLPLAIILLLFLLGWYSFLLIVALTEARIYLAPLGLLIALSVVPLSVTTFSYSSSASSCDASGPARATGLLR